MHPDSIIIVIAFAALVLSPYFLRRFSRSKSSDYGSFAVGNRDFGWFRICAGLSATFVGGAAVINLAGLGYTFGYFGLADVLPTSLALLFSALVLVPKIKEKSGISLGGYLRGSSKLAGGAVGLLSAVVYTLVSAAQIIALIKLAQPFFPGVPAAAIAGIGTCAVAAYIYFGGYSAVTVTDVIQFVVMATLYFALVGVTLVISESQGSGPVIAPKAMDVDLILLLGLSLFFVPISQDVHIRINSAKSEKDARLGVLLAGVCYLIFGLVSIGVGMSLAQAGVALANPDDAVPTFLSQHFGSYAIIPTIAVVCVVVSTLDSVLFASASSLAYDFWDSLAGGKKDRDSDHPRIGTLIVLGVALFIAIQAPQILRLILSALVIYISVLVPMLAGRYLNKDSRSQGILAFVVLGAILALEVSGFSASYRAFLYTAVHLVLVGLIKKQATAWPRATARTRGAFVPGLLGANGRVHQHCPRFVRCDPET
jgi:solute:Na+ symporter, SSS family